MQKLIFWGLIGVLMGAGFQSLARDHGEGGEGAQNRIEIEGAKKRCEAAEKARFEKMFAERHGNVADIRRELETEKMKNITLQRHLDRYEKMHKKLTADYIERGRQLEESGLSGVIAKAKKNGQNNIPQLKPALCVFDAAPAPKPPCSRRRKADQLAADRALNRACKDFAPARPAGAFLCKFCKNPLFA